MTVGDAALAFANGVDRKATTLVSFAPAEIDASAWPHFFALASISALPAP